MTAGCFRRRTWTAEPTKYGVGRVNLFWGPRESICQIGTGRLLFFGFRFVLVGGGHDEHDLYNPRLADDAICVDAVEKLVDS